MLPASSRHRALRNTRRRPAAWSPSGTPLGLDPGKSGRQAEQVISCLSSASSTGARSKVIAEQPVVGLKKDYIYIRDRQLFWFGDGRYLHLMHNGILHLQHKALEATKWIFDLGLSPRYTTERLEKRKTLFFFFYFFLTEALCSMKVLKNTTIAFNMTNVAAWRSVIMVWFSWINNLPPHWSHNFAKSILRAVFCSAACGNDWISSWQSKRLSLMLPVTKRKN